MKNKNMEPKKDYGDKIDRYLAKKKPEKREKHTIQKYYLEPFEKV